MSGTNPSESKIEASSFSIGTTDSVQPMREEVNQFWSQNGNAEIRNSGNSSAFTSLPNLQITDSTQPKAAGSAGGSKGTGGNPEDGAPLATADRAPTRIPNDGVKPFSDAAPQTQAPAQAPQEAPSTPQQRTFQPRGGLFFRRR